MFIPPVENLPLQKYTKMKIEFFHNSRLIRWIKQKIKFTKNYRLDQGLIACLAVRYLNHYTRMFSVFVWGCNWILLESNWRKITSFWKKLECVKNKNPSIYNVIGLHGELSNLAPIPREIVLLCPEHEAGEQFRVWVQGVDTVHSARWFD